MGTRRDCRGISSMFAVFLARDGDGIRFDAMEPAARARLDRWTQSLLDNADRLLDLADDGIPLAGDPVRIVFALVGGTRITMPRTPELVALRRSARDAF